MKKQSKNLIIIIILIISLSGFYKINSLNYQKHNDIKNSFIKHPENLPRKEVAVNTSFWFKSIKADFYRLEAIQYIWSNAIWSEYKKYLFSIIDIITELNPYFEHPYILWQLLIPSYNKRYENLSKTEQDKNIEQWVKIWLKWIKNFCDPKKIELIKNEDDLRKIWTEEKYKNPCSNYDIPNYLAYIYFYYKNEPAEASQYYKIASAVENWLSWSKIMAAIMAWKWWNRKKSYFMFLNIAKSIKSDNKVCNIFSNNLEKVWIEIFNNKSVKLNSSVLKNISNTRDKIFWKFNKDNEKKVLSDTNCWNYLNKAIRELNLKYIEDADKKYLNDKWIHSKNAKELFDKWYINYIPLDYQQYDDYSIIYEYNSKTWNYDYVMWNYDD